MKAGEAVGTTVGVIVVVFLVIVAVAGTLTHPLGAVGFIVLSVVLFGLVWTIRSAKGTAPQQATPHQTVIDSIQDGGTNLMFSPEEVTEEVSENIGAVFSSAHFTDLFKDYTLKEGWSIGDALAVWYSLGNLALVLAAWAAYKDQMKAFRIIDHGRSVLLKCWNVSGSTRDKLMTFINDTEASAVASYVKCKTQNDFSLFFSRYVSCILGKPMRFSDQNLLKDLLEGVEYGQGSTILVATVSGMFTSVFKPMLKLLREAAIDWNSPIPKSDQT